MANAHSDNARQARREQARLARLETSRHPVAASQPQALFGAPIKVHRDDTVSKRVKDVLGEFEPMKPTFDSGGTHSLIGVPRQPATPVAKQPPGNGGSSLFATPNRPNGLHKPDPHRDKHHGNKSSTSQKDSVVVKTEQNNVNNKEHVHTSKQYKPAYQGNQATHSNKNAKNGDSNNGPYRKGSSGTVKGENEKRRRSHSRSASRSPSRKRNDSSASHSSQSSSQTEIVTSPPAKHAHKTLSPVPQDKKPIDTATMKTPAVNGVRKKNLPKLHIPSSDQTKSSKDLSAAPRIEDVFQEMIVQPPLTGIQTPRKDDGSRFPFPGSAKLRSHPKKPNTRARVPGILPSKRAHVPKDASKKKVFSPARKGKSREHERRRLSLLPGKLEEDLQLSDDSDAETENKKKQMKHTNRHSQLSESSSDSGSGSSSDSESGSGESSGSSDDEKEAKREKNGQDGSNSMQPQKWSLESFLQKTKTDSPLAAIHNENSSDVGDMATDVQVDPAADGMVTSCMERSNDELFQGLDQMLDEVAAKSKHLEMSEEFPTPHDILKDVQVSDKRGMEIRSVEAPDHSEAEMSSKNESEARRDKKLNNKQERRKSEHKKEHKERKKKENEKGKREGKSSEVNNDNASPSKKRLNSGDDKLLQRLTVDVKKLNDKDVIEASTPTLTPKKMKFPSTGKKEEKMKTKRAQKVKKDNKTYTSKEFVSSSSDSSAGEEEDDLLIDIVGDNSPKKLNGEIKKKNEIGQKDVLSCLIDPRALLPPTLLSPLPNHDMPQPGITFDENGKPCVYVKLDLGLLKGFAMNKKDKSRIVNNKQENVAKQNGEEQRNEEKSSVAVSESPKIRKERDSKKDKSESKRDKVESKKDKVDSKKDKVDSKLKRKERESPAPKESSTKVTKEIVAKETTKERKDSAKNKKEKGSPCKEFSPERVKKQDEGKKKRDRDSPVKEKHNFTNLKRQNSSDSKKDRSVSPEKNNKRKKPSSPSRAKKEKQESTLKQDAIISDHLMELSPDDIKPAILLSPLSSDNSSDEEETGKRFVQERTDPDLRISENVHLTPPAENLTARPHEDSDLVSKILADPGTVTSIKVPSTKRKKEMDDQNNPKRIKKTENKKEKSSHEDDHSWDRKQHPRSRQGSMDSTFSTSSHSSSTHEAEQGKRQQTVKENGVESSPSYGHHYHHSYDKEMPKGFENTSSEFHLREAQSLKHDADIVIDRWTKSLVYSDACLHFLLHGHIMESDSSNRSKEAYEMYKATLQIVKYIMRCLRGLSEQTRHDPELYKKEKRLAVLCLRIQSLLCLRLYKLRKAETMRLKAAIDEHNKASAASSSKPPAQAPSPYQNTWNNRSTGTPSPMSPQPSPASIASIGSVGSQGSCNNEGGAAKASNGSASGCAMSSPATVNIPARIHSVTQQYMSHTNYILMSHDLWDQADVQMADHNVSEFFERLSRQYGQLTMHSSFIEVVRFVGWGLHRLREV